MDLVLLILALSAILLVAITVVFFSLVFANSLRDTRDLTRPLALTTLHFRLWPSHEDQTENLAHLTEKLFILLSGLRSRGRFKDRLIYNEPYVVFEVKATVAGLTFSLAAPRVLEDHIKKCVYNIFRHVELDHRGPNNPFLEKAKTVFSTLGLRDGAMVPLPNYTNLAYDPIAQLLAKAHNLRPDESLAVQLLCRPAPVNYNTALLSAAEHIQPEASLLGESMREHLREKASHPIFLSNLRLMAQAPNEPQAHGLLAELEDVYKGLTDQGLNCLIAHEVPREVTAFNFAFKIFNPELSMALSTRELASAFHLANETSASLPENPSETKAQEQDICLGTVSQYGNEPLCFSSAVSRFSHCYIVGQTGTGKSVLMANMISQDLERGRGVAVIDPHGDLIETVINLVPAGRLNDVIYFNPADTEYPIGLNMLDVRQESDRDFVVQEMVSIFQKLFPSEFVGPIFEHNMRNVLLTLMADLKAPGTLVEVPRLMTDEVFVKRYLSQVKDPMVRDFWTRERAHLSAADQAEVVPYIVSKLGRFIENRMMRNILGQTRASLDWTKIIKSQSILLVNLAKGQLGELNAALLGLIITSKLQLAAMGQAGEPEAQRQPFYLYIDEFQNFTTESIASVLSEARKYRLGLTIAHQFMGQLTRPIREAVLGNAATAVAFRLSPDDARLMSESFGDNTLLPELVNLTNFEAFVKLATAKGVAVRRLKTEPPLIVPTSVGEAIGTQSRLQYGRLRREVEAEIASRLR